MFANILQQGTLADDAAGATFLVLGAIPAAYFLLLTVLAPAPALCADASPDASAASPMEVEAPAPRPTSL
jgi:hypothetical protein